MYTQEQDVGRLWTRQAQEARKGAVGARISRCRVRMELCWRAELQRWKNLNAISQNGATEVSLFCQLAQL